MAKGDLTIQLDRVSYQKFMSIVGQLEKADQAPAVRAALTQAIKDIVDAGKSNLNERNGVKTGNLKKSFTRKVQAKKGVAYAGFKRSAPGKRVQGANHSYLVDRGTAKRWTSKGYYRGSVSKKSPNTGSMFWTDAVQSQGPEAMNRLMDAIYRTLYNISTR